MERFWKVTPRRRSRFSGPRGLFLIAAFLCTAFIPFDVPEKQQTGPCDFKVKPFTGYTFLHAEIINKNAAYAPFFVTWDDYYQRYYFSRDIQREENVKEWIGRFCDQPAAADVDYVVYKSSFDELATLRGAASDKTGKGLLPYSLGGNTFAEMLAVNGCTEVIDYLMYAKKCEPYVIPVGDGWTPPARDYASMQMLIQEGLGRFDQTKSQFIRLRYAYQVVRLAHYAGQWEQTVDLYNFFLPKIDRPRPSIIFYWMVGHLAGALQKLEKYPEAAYRFSQVFRHCASKRTQAYRSFLIRNDQDWEQTMKLCQTDAEKATLYVLRAGGTHTYAVEDMQTIYQLDPANPQLDLLLVSDIQQLEKIFLRTPVTDRRFGVAESAIRRDKAADHLLALQTFVRQAIKDGKLANPRLWECTRGYLELLAGDLYAAEKTFDRAVKSVKSSMDKTKDKEDKAYFQQLLDQIEVWRTLLEILNIDPKSVHASEAAFRIRSYKTYQQNASFAPFLQDYLADAYAEANRPGKAFMAAYEAKALRYRPRLDVIDDLLRALHEEDPRYLDIVVQLDTTPEKVRAELLEIKAVALFSQGQPEAALAVLRSIPEEYRVGQTEFQPFKEVFDERVNRQVSDTLSLTRQQIIAKLIDYEFQAKAAIALNEPIGAFYYYMIGLGYYNMSYFGYEWEAMDYYRSGYNWLRLAQGPVFPLRGSPDGNRENIDVSLALSYFEQALENAKSPELAARAAFMAARCEQKMWFIDPACNYRFGSNLIPLLPQDKMRYYTLLENQYSGTDFYNMIIKECKWFGAYARRN